MLIRTRSLLFLLAIASGCSVVVDGRILPKAVDCVGVDDGTPCVGGDYCFVDQCRFSFCGDSIVNADRGEECDDGNLTAGDGCEPQSCKFSCDGDTPCPDNGFVCDGPESCNASTHECTSGPNATAGADCVVPVSSSAGDCNMGFCVPAGCGDGTIDPATEECEPPAMGCMIDCRWECESDAECPTGDPCENARHCDVAGHSCIDDGPLNCDDGNDCTADSCSAGLGGCSSAAIDADSDGYSPQPVCATGGPTAGGDCDDANDARHPGATELFNGIDDDCDGDIDEGAVTITCYRDRDGDRYGDVDDSVGPVEVCPDGYVQNRGDGFDCSDVHENVNPGVADSEWFDLPYCLDGSTPVSKEGIVVCQDDGPYSYDYDCNRDETQEHVELAGNTCAATCSGEGWGDEIPRCGATGSWTVCTFSHFGCFATVAVQTQRCR